MQIDTWPWSHTYWGHMVLIGPQVCKCTKFYILRLSYKLISHDLWPSFVTIDHMNLWRFLHFINKPNLVPIGLQLFKWGEFYILSPFYNLTSDDLWPGCMTFDHMKKQRVSYCINKPSLVPIELNRILQLDLRWPLTLMWPLTSTNEGSHVASMNQLWLKSMKACGR